MFGHLLPVLPLLLVPIFEPYHYSVMWAPVVVLLAWTAQQWMTNWKLKGILPVALIGYLASQGDAFERTIRLEESDALRPASFPSVCGCAKMPKIELHFGSPIL